MYRPVGIARDISQIIKRLNLISKTAVAEKNFGSHFARQKQQELIIIYITIGVSSGRESKEGEIMLQFEALH